MAGSLFTANVAQDRPLAQRRADIARLRERIGEFAPDPDRPAEFDSPAHCRWWLTGPRGSASVQIKLAPLMQARVQQVVLAVPPAPDSALAKTVAAVIATINAGAAEWPADLAVAPGADLRQLRLAAAWAGQCQPGGWAAGDGSSTATVELTGPTGQVVLTVEVSGSGPAAAARRGDAAALARGLEDDDRDLPGRLGLVVGEARVVGLLRRPDLGPLLASPPPAR